MKIETLDLEDKVKSEKLVGLSQELGTSKTAEDDLKAKVVSAEKSIEELVQKMEGQDREHQVIVFTFTCPCSVGVMKLS